MVPLETPISIFPTNAAFRYQPDSACCPLLLPEPSAYPGTLGLATTIMARYWRTRSHQVSVGSATTVPT